MDASLEPGCHGPDDGRPIRIAGDLLLVKALTGIADGVAVLETVAEPGEPAPLDHVHRSYDEVFYVLEGAFEFRIGDRRVRADAGNVVTVPRGNAHTFHNCGASRARILLVAAPGRVVQMLEDIGAMLAISAGGGPQALAAVYEAHDTVLVPPLPDADVGAT